MPIHVKMGDPAYGGHAICKRKNTQLNHSMAPKEPYRESEWADVSPLLKYISGAVAPRLKAPKGPYQASYIELSEIRPKIILKLLRAEVHMVPIW